MIIHRQWNRQGANRAEVPLRPLVPLTIELLVLELSHALLACLLVPLAVGPLAVHAAVLDESAGRAVLEPDGVTPVLAAVSTGSSAIDEDGHVVHLRIEGLMRDGCKELGKWYPLVVMEGPKWKDPP